MDYIGFNSRLSELNCALGSNQIDRLNKNIKKRNKIAFFYNKIFKNIKNLKIPEVKKGNYCSYHLYPLRFNWEKKNKQKKFL